MVSESNNPNFIGAVVETEQDGQKVYIPCVYNVTFKKVVWTANYCNDFFDKALRLSSMIAELIEEDFEEFIETGKKNNELISMLGQAGKFDNLEVEQQNKQQLN